MVLHGFPVVAPKVTKTESRVDKKFNKEAVIPKKKVVEHLAPVRQSSKKKKKKK